MSFDAEGFEIIESVLPIQAVENLLDSVTQLKLEPLRGGIRRIENLLPNIALLSQSPRFANIAQKHITGKTSLVRAIYFEKSPENNWFVTWHQDRTVAVSARFEWESWGPWSIKAGAWHVQPPLEVLENMVTIRLHLDDATIENGCLKVIPGSHKYGLISTDNVMKHVHKTQAIHCESTAGGVVVMRPNILHASEKSVTPKPRRILHFEYSGFQLPKGIAWAT